MSDAILVRPRAEFLRGVSMRDAGTLIGLVVILAVFDGSLFGLPLAVIIVALVAVVAWIVLKKTPFGEYLLAVGGNEEAAYIAGVPIARTKIAAYMISGLLAALAAQILIGRLGAAE